MNQLIICCLPVVIFCVPYVLCSQGIPIAESFANCRQRSIYQHETYPECNAYPSFPIYDMTINCTTGLLQWMVSGSALVPREWAKHLLMKIYRTCNKPSLDENIKTISEELEKSGGEYKDSLLINDTTGLSCTYGTCNYFNGYHCWILNEQEVSCPGTTANTANPLSSSTNTTITSTTLQCTSCISSSSMNYAKSSSLSVVTSSSFHHSQYHHLTMSNSILDSSVTPTTTDKTFTSATLTSTDATNRTDSDSDQPLLLRIIAIAVSIAAVAIFVAVSSICIMARQKYRICKSSKILHSEDSSTEMNDFQNVTNVVYNKGLPLTTKGSYNGAGSKTDKISSNGSLLTIYEDIIFKSPFSDIQLKCQPNTIGNPYVFTASSFGDDETILRATSTVLLPRGSSNDVHHSSSASSMSSTSTVLLRPPPPPNGSSNDVHDSSSASSLSSGIGVPSAGRLGYMSNSGKPTNIDDIMKKLKPELY